MARGTNSSKYIQSIGPQDLRERATFSVPLLTDAFWVGVCMLCTEGKVYACIRTRKRDTQSFSVSVLRGTKSSAHAVDANIGIFPYRLSAIHFITHLCAWPHFNCITFVTLCT